jgi:PAS domain S-box-containing protein
VSVNRAFYHKLGYKRTAVLGRQLREFLANPSDYEALTALWPKLWSEGRGRNVRLNFAGREGAVLNCSAHASIASSDTGERTALFVLTDETERRRAEEAAQTSRTFLDAVSDAIIIMERDTGRIVKVNDRFRHIFGYDASEAGGLTLCALAGEDPPGLLNRMEAASAAGELLEWQARAKDGRLFWVEANARLIDEDDSARIVAALRDVSSRKQTELELTHLRAAVEDTTAAVLIADVSGQPTYFNMAFGNLFGYTRQQAAEVRFPGLCVDEPRGAHLLEAIHAGRSWEGELAMRSRDGREFPAYLRGAPILDDAFEVAGLAFVLNDMTERKQIEAQLLQSQNIKSIGQLAAGIAHEINTPMQYVGDNTRFLQESFADLSKVLTTYEDALEAGASPEKITAAARAAEDADVAYLIEEIPAAIAQTLEGVDRVTTIVRAMRQFTHPGTDDKTMVNLNDLVQSTATVAQNEYKYVAEADLRLDDELPDAPCLRGDLNQVILNLIVNAAHAIGEAIDESKGERGVITITTRHDADCVELRIADTGTGIPPDIQDRIFDPFFTTKDVGKGTGQGLAICHAVVAEKHGGTLTFETTPGQGTEFIIRLPRRNPAVPGPGQDAMESTDGHD